MNELSLELDVSMEPFISLSEPRLVHFKLVLLLLLEFGKLLKLELESISWSRKSMFSPSLIPMKDSVAL